MSETRPVFSNANDGNGLIQECERVTTLGAGGISGVTQLLKDFTARINNAIDRFFVLAFQYDKNWTLDDRGFGDNDITKGLPILATNLVSGTGDYLFDTDILMIEQVFLADSNGTFHELLPSDDKSSPEIYTKPTQSGTPTTYALVGNSIILNYLPNYSSSGGLKVKCRRVGRHFVYTDGAVALGIPPVFFGYIARYASYPYLLENGLRHAPSVLKQIGSAVPRDPFYGGDELAIANFMSLRGKPKRTRLVGGKQDNK